MKDIGYYNGKTGPINEMMVPMNDRACYFGDGVFSDAEKFLLIVAEFSVGEHFFLLFFGWVTFVQLF